MVFQTNMNAPTQKCAHGQHYAGRGEFKTDLGNHPGYPAVFNQQVIDCLLKYVQIGLIFQGAPYGGLVQQPVRLCPGGTYRRPLARVEYAEMDTRPVRRPRHQPTQRIHFLHQVTLANTANGRVAAHLSQGIDIVGEQQCACAHACRRQCCLGASMAAADNDDLIFLRMQHEDILGPDYRI